MAITADEVANVLNNNGIDTSEKFANFLSQAGPLIQRNALLSKIDALRIKQAQDQTNIQEQINDLTDQIAQIDAGLRGN